MKKYMWLVLVGMLLFGEPILAEKEVEGTLTLVYLEGEVEILKKGAKEWEKAKLYTALGSGDRIRTRLGAKCDLRFADGSVINIYENSIMDIKELLEKGLTKKSSFKLWIGKIKARIKRLRTKDSSVNFYTPTAVMGLRGTILWLSVDWQGRTRCAFTEGSGYIYTEKEGERRVGEGEEAEVNLEGDITVRRLETSVVPNVVRMRLSDARTTIVGAQLSVGNIRATESTEPPDTVLSQNPKAGEVVPRQTSVNLTVAVPIPPVVVPNLIGMNRSSAESAILGAGLSVGRIFYIESDIERDRVIKQNPQAGTEVKEGSAVDLLLSEGPPEKVKVPNLYGKTIRQAESALSAVGLRMGNIVEKETSDSELIGRVIGQRPAAGSMVKEGSFVDVEKGVEKERVIPLPTIHHRFSTAERFVNDVPYLLIRVTPQDPVWAPLFLEIEGRRTQLSAPPYFTRFRPVGLRTGENVINVSAWFSGGERVDKAITTPYIDFVSPTIVSASKAGDNLRVVVRDTESGIEMVKVGGRVCTLKSGTQEERTGVNVYVRAVYEIPISSLLPSNRPEKRVKIEVEDNAGNKRERYYNLLDAPPRPDQIPQ
jgi:beta-lactam-binding protein with PASTA domain